MPNAPFVRRVSRQGGLPVLLPRSLGPDQHVDTLAQWCLGEFSLELVVLRVALPGHLSAHLAKWLSVSSQQYSGRTIRIDKTISYVMLRLLAGRWK